VIQKLTAFSGQIFSKLSQNDHPTNLLTIRLVVAFFSALLTVIAIATDDIINPDGALYVDVARMAINDGVIATAQLYNWSFYPFLAAGLSQLTTLSITTSFYVLNTVLFILLTDAFTCISYQRLKQTNHVVIACILILFFYTLNDYRDFIIRDIGYWALCLYSFYHFISFKNSRQLKHIYSCQYLLLLASLFRVEAIPLLLVMPLFLLLDKEVRKVKFFIHAYSWLLSAGIIVVSAILFLPSSTELFSKINQLTYYLNVDKTVEFFNHASLLINTEIIQPAMRGKEFGEIILITGFISVVLSLVLTAFSIPYIILSLLALKTDTTVGIKQANDHFWLSLLVFQVVLLFIFFFSSQIQTTRYCVLAGLILLITLLPTLTNYIANSFAQKKKLHMALISLLLLYSGIDAFHQSNSKTYLISSCETMSEFLPENSVVSTNSRVIKYYLERYAPNTTITIHKHNVSSAELTHYVIEKRKLASSLEKSLKNNGWTLSESVVHKSKKLLLFTREKP
jgi:6-pyruvoyl-tetrahydropterin synthase